MELARIYRLLPALTLSCGLLRGRVLTTFRWATSTISRLFLSRIGTATYLLSPVAAHWWGRPVSLMAAITLSWVVSMILRVFSGSIVVNSRLQSDCTAEQCNR